MIKPAVAPVLAIALMALFGASFLIVRLAVASMRTAHFFASRIASQSRLDRTSGADMKIAGIDVTVWRPQGRAAAPLVIFSHGFHGSSRQSVFLMKALAEHGYLVIAPNHRDAMRRGGTAGSIRPEEGFAKVDAWNDSTYKDRADDIRSLIAALKRDPAWSGAIDWAKIALAGHSLGGYTVLGLAGAWPSWKLPNVRAVLALSPYANPYIKGKTLSGIKAPVMYQSGTLDFGIGPFAKKHGGAYDQTPSPAYYVEFQGAGHFAWTDLNPKFQPDIVYYCVAYLDRYVKGDRSADPARKLSDVSDLRSK